MKKLFAVLLVIALLVVPMSLSASAAGTINSFEKAVLESLDENVKVDDTFFHVPQEYITQAENFLKTIDMTEAQSKTILEKIDDCKEIITAGHIKNTSDLKVLPQAEKQKLLDNGKAAAAAVNGEFIYDGENVKVTHNGKTVFEDAPVVKVTGAEADYTAIVLSVAGVIAVLAAAAVVARKKGLLVK